MSTEALKVIKAKYVLDSKGNKIQIESSIDENEINFLNKLIEENNYKHSLEVGCAMGISALTICEALQKNDPLNSSHIIVDPFQSTDWQNIGINNLKKAGFSNYQLFEERSEFILPRLAESGTTIDFAFIDGWHTFDHTLIDFFYLNRMLKKGGIIVIDDIAFPALNKLMRFIHRYPCYKHIGSVKIKKSIARKFLEITKSIIRPITKLFGKRTAFEIFSASVLKSDASLGLNSSMIAFKKIAEDTRPWNWHEDF